MSDRDTITLPREVARLALSYIEWYIENEGGGRFVQVREAAEALRTALAAETPKHPGYVIGSHWLETAYSRICAGEAEADVLRDCGWERVDEALRRDAERYRWLQDAGQKYWMEFADMTAEATEAAIDAAMERKR